MLGRRYNVKHSVYLSYVESVVYCRDCCQSRECDCDELDEEKMPIKKRRKIWYGQTFTGVKISNIVTLISRENVEFLKIEFASSGNGRPIKTDDTRCHKHFHCGIYRLRCKELKM